MTSSLVGSEMCIRDRWTRHNTETGGIEPLEDTDNDNKEAMKDPDTTQQAVSYTHLTLPTICSV
eukprot:12452127-Prorocentrum_lima.AAC.1